MIRALIYVNMAKTCYCKKTCWSL